MSHSVKDFFLKTITNLPIKNEGDIFSIQIGDESIRIAFEEKIATVTKEDKTRDIQLDLGAEKFFTAQKGLFRNLESYLKEINDKKTYGQLLSAWKKEVESLIFLQEQAAKELALQEKLQKHLPEISAAPLIIEPGYEHFLNKVRNEMLAVFQSMGYSLFEERELEDEFHNFEALNIGPEHPAREDHDSFYVGEGHLMRTHTSCAQIRGLEKMLREGGSPPIALVSPGLCYRRDAVDATHFPSFRQMEGLVVDKNVSFADLKGTLLNWAKAMFGSDTKIRLRPDYFPFTEPSAELSVSSPHLLGGRWIELLGCGMVHPNVFRNVGLDPEVWSGFAFGTGIERIAMIRYGIKDIRLFFENDVRFLKQSL
ncbi:MAG: phenylalanine--tRNA ligase subunit alpha [Brevinema sp.]